MDSRLSFRFLLLVIVLAAAPLLAQAPPPESDLLVQKSGPATAAAGADVPYTVTVTNLGPDTAVSPQLVDLIPAGMTFVSLTQNSGTTFVCSTPAVGSGGSIDCTTATFLAGESASFTVVLNIPGQAAPGSSFVNIANVTLGADTNEENNSASVATTIPTNAADLSVTKSGPGSAGPNTDVTYTIVLTNGGPNTASTVSMTDMLPATTTFVSLNVSGSAMSCSTPAVGAGGEVTCTAASYAAGASTTLTLTVHIPADVPAGTEITNGVSVTSSTDPTEENNTASTTLIVSSADVAIVKAGPATANAGTNQSYTITLTNNGPDFAENVTFSDSLPAGTTFVSLTQDSGAAATCFTPPAGGTGAVNCTVPLMANGVSAAFTLVLNVGTAPSITNTATVTTGSFDPNNLNDSSSVVTTITPVADVSIVKSGPASVVAGTNLTYQLTVSNAGPSTAANVVLNDVVPAGTTFVSFVQNSGPLFNCTTGATVNCTAATLASAANATFTLVVSVPAGGTGVVSNTATLASATSDPNLGNNSSTSNATIAVSADVALVKSGAASVAAGNDLTYTLTLTNGGPSDATAVTLADTLPANTTFVSFAQNTGASFNCTTPAAGGTGAVNCTLATFLSGASATFTLVVHVDPAATGTITNTATVAATGDTNPANNSSNVQTTVAPSADLSVTKSGTATVAAGANATYTVTVANAGPSVATNVVLSDAVPAQTTFVSATQNSGPAFTCTTPAAGGTGTISCSIASLAPGANATFTIVVATQASAVGTFTNTATVSSATTDPVNANNTASANTAIDPGPTDVSIVKTANGGTFPPGAVITYTIVVTNNGPAVAFNVVVTDPLPAGMSAISSTSTQGTCSGTTTVTCSVGTLAIGSSATISIQTALPPLPGDVSNTATVTMSNSNTNPGGGVSGAAAISVVAGATIPTLSTWMMLMMAVLLAGIAIVRQ